MDGLETVAAALPVQNINLNEPAAAMRRKAEAGHAARRPTGFAQRRFHEGDGAPCRVGVAYAP